MSFDVIAYEQSLPRKRLASAALIGDGDGRYLFVELSYKDGLVLPGGSCDAHEGSRAAVIREVREEVGLDIAPDHLAAVVFWNLDPVRHDLVEFLWVVPRVDPGLVVIDQDEIIAAHWLTIDNALPLMTANWQARVQVAATGAQQQRTVWSDNGQAEDGQDYPVVPMIHGQGPKPMKRYYTPEDNRIHVAGLPRQVCLAGVVVRDDGGRVLLVKPTYKDGWSLPGGAVEGRESPRAAAAREALEELGIQVSVGALLSVSQEHRDLSGVDMTHFLFAGTVEAGAVLHPDPAEVAEVRWVPPDRLAGMVPPGLERALNRVLSTPNRWTDVTEQVIS